jgi:FixJ family two-component response regulator
MEAGADAFLTKPFDPAALRAQIQVAERVIQLEQLSARQLKELSPGARAQSTGTWKPRRIFTIAIAHRIFRKCPEWPFLGFRFLRRGCRRYFQRISPG